MSAIKLGSLSVSGNRNPRIAGMSVVVPVYGSEAILPELVRRLEPVLAANADEFELILVNDCSPDGSWKVICDLAREHSLDLRREPDAKLRAAQRPLVRHPDRPL
jgi:hypothetical protein